MSVSSLWIRSYLKKMLAAFAKAELRLRREREKKKSDIYQMKYGTITFGFSFCFNYSFVADSLEKKRHFLILRFKITGIIFNLIFERFCDTTQESPASHKLQKTSFKKVLPSQLLIRLENLKNKAIEIMMFFIVNPIQDQ